MDAFLPHDLSRALGDELSPGETAVWQSQPPQWRMARTKAREFFIGIPFTAFAVAWTFAAAGGFAKAKAPPPGLFHYGFIAWGCMFVGFGLWTLGSPLRAAWLATRTAYAVTDRRAIVLTVARRKTVRQFDAGQLGQLTRVENADGSGDLVFDRVVTQVVRGGTRTKEIGFFGIADVRSIERLVRERGDPQIPVR